MNIIACYKIVYEEQDIVVKPDSTLSFERAELKLSLYDLNAIEAVVRLAKETGGVSKLLTAAEPSKADNSKLRKGVLSRGPEELFIVKDPSLADPDTYQTAQVLAAAAKKIGFDVIICGEGSADQYAQQTGIQLGIALDVPVINAISSIKADGGKLTVERTIEGGIQVFDISTPCVICVTSDINEPAIPTMKDILGAGKKPVTELTFADLGFTLPENTVEIVSTLAPKQAERKMIIVEGDDKVAELFEQIRNEIK